jgi:hypothetical protein
MYIHISEISDTFTCEKKVKTVMVNKTNKIMTYDITNLGPTCRLGKANNVTGLNRLMIFQPSALDNWISSTFK